jgi:hypothetical protein
MDVSGLVGQATHPHLRAAVEKVLEDVPSGDSIAPIGGIGHSLAQEQDLHDGVLYPAKPDFSRLVRSVLDTDA